MTISSRTTWLLEPFDTVFFREGRAFQRGEAAEVQSVFPPPPTTLQGLVRSKLLADHCGRWMAYRDGCRTPGGPCEKLGTCEVRPVVGERRGGQAGEGGDGTLKIRGPWLMVGRESVLPIPADVVAEKAEFEKLETDPNHELATILLAPDDTGRASNMHGALRMLTPTASVDQFATVKGWMAWGAWQEYLGGDAPRLTRGQNWWSDGDLWAQERRPGVAIEPGRNRARDHHLYFAQHVRLSVPRASMDEVRMAFECSGVPDALLDPVRQFPVCAAGGEMRAATIAFSDAPPWYAIPFTLKPRLDQAKRLKVVLLQPAWFEAAWHPRGWVSATLQTPYGGWTWAGALVSRPAPVGGWDLAARREKKVRPFIPAGAVFYLECKNRVASPVDALWNACLSDTPAGDSPTLQSMGFGHALVGIW